MDRRYVWSLRGRDCSEGEGTVPGMSARVTTIDFRKRLYGAQCTVCHDHQQPSCEDIAGLFARRLRHPTQERLRVQVLPNMNVLPYARKAQSAAFVTHEGLLIVWDDGRLTCTSYIPFHFQVSS